MAPKPSLAAAAFLLPALLFSLATVHGSVAAVASAADLPRSRTRDIPAVFAFGDSTLDAGNNNRLVTAVRADHPPYGQDFPGGSPTGRFSDGKIMTDFLVEALGIKGLLPAYHSGAGASVLSDADAATGVSFASGGSGLDDTTAMNAGVATMASQVADFSELVGRMGADKAGAQLNKSVFVVSSGTNDMIMNYYLLPSSMYTLDQYHGLLIGKLRSYIQSLYNLGARRILVAGLPPVGCLPLQMTLAAARPQGCVPEQNAAAGRYNAKLRRMLAKFRSSSPGAKAVYADIYSPLMDMVDHPQKYGFAETGKGCCGTGLLEMGPLCTDLVPICTTPSKFMFWDSVHPTQATYKAIADHFLRTNVLHFDD